MGDGGVRALSRIVGVSHSASSQQGDYPNGTGMTMVYAERSRQQVVFSSGEREVATPSCASHNACMISLLRYAKEFAENFGFGLGKERADRSAGR